MANQLPAVAASSANPFGGDDPRAEEIKTLCRDYAEEMVDVLRTIALDPDEKGAPRVKAAETILNHAIGAPSRKIEKTVDHHLHDHRSAQLAVFRKLADKRAKEQLQIAHIEDAEFEEVEKAAAAKKAERGAR